MIAMLLQLHMLLVPPIFPTSHLVEKEQAKNKYTKGVLHSHFTQK